MEGLNVAMKTAVDKRVFDGIKFQNPNICLSHLFYADDALFIGEWSRRNIDNLARILRCFYVSSGWKVNFSKSKVFGVGASPSEISNWSAPLGCKPSSLPFTYLGIPVSLRPLRELEGDLFGAVKLKKKSISWVAWDTLIAPKNVGMITLHYGRKLFEVSTTWMEDNGLFLPIDPERNIFKIRPILKHFNIDPNEIVYWNPTECCWASDFVIDHRFSVRLLRERIELAGHVVCDGPFEWCKVILFKVLCFIWRAKLGRIPSSVALKPRGVTVPSVMCGSCNMEEELSDHILLKYPLTKVVIGFDNFLV
uniref:Reverse transcriptase zinc-binding domain-containing protein n=1 Tax=Lactuca sativa TaxID=4236 RepID=A0A9R1UJ71_LACSA|nr:hypothetical protein LSAT_V11C900495760 [Lactuca sativa]